MINYWFWRYYSRQNISPRNFLSVLINHRLTLLKLTLFFTFLLVKPIFHFQTHIFASWGKFLQKFNFISRYVTKSKLDFDDFQQFLSPNFSFCGNWATFMLYTSRDIPTKILYQIYSRGDVINTPHPPPLSGDKELTDK